MTQSQGNRTESILQFINLGVVGDVTNAYTENVWAYSAVKAISTNISGIPFNLRKYERSGDMGSDIIDPKNKFVELFENPNPLFDQTQLWKLTSILYETKGEVFWVLYNAQWEPISLNEIPTYIEVALPNSIKPRYDQSRRMVGWDYKRDALSGEHEKLHFHNCLRFFEVHPDGILKSLSPYEVAKISIGIDYKVHLFNDKFFKSGGQISGYLLDENKDSELTEDDIRGMTKVWNDQYGGLNNAHKTPFLTNGVKFVQTGTTQKDMDFYNLTRITREEIVGALNVPKSQVGLYEDLNFATAKIADRQFFTNNLLPKMIYFASVLNSKLLHKHGVDGYFDFTTIEALKEDREKKIKAARMLFDLGYSLNEVNSAQDLGMSEIEEEWANTPINTREEEEDGEDGLQTRENEADQDTQPDREADREQDGLDMKTIADFLFSSSEKPNYTEFAENYIKKVINPQSFLARPKLVTFFNKLRNAQLKALDTNQDALYFADLDKVLFNLDEWTSKYVSVISTFQTQASEGVVDFTLDEAKELGADVSKITDEATDAIISGAVERMYSDGSHTIKNLHKRLYELFSVSANNSTPLDEVKQGVRDILKVVLSNINTLSRTEITGVANEVRFLIMAEIPKAQKVWVALEEGNSRDNHKKFGDLGAKSLYFEYALGLKYPGDRKGPLEDVVGCRCFTKLVLED